MIDSRSRDDARFCIIDAVYRDAVSYEFPRETDALIALLWRWEYNELVIVELMVRKGDQLAGWRRSSSRFWS